MYAKPCPCSSQAHVDTIALDEVAPVTHMSILRQIRSLALCSETYILFVACKSYFQDIVLLQYACSTQMEHMIAYETVWFCNGPLPARVQSGSPDRAGIASS